ncbi:MAG: hypothetical protein HGA19_08395 [Oscillochloris sp.]|nr:hypothetical protein [Oscillochloris sp.]
MAAQKRLAELSSTSKNYEANITENLFALSKSAVSSFPAYDPTVAANREGRYLFYKPVLYRSSEDKLYYRGMVRLEVTTQKIVAPIASHGLI